MYSLFRPSVRTLVTTAFSLLLTQNLHAGPVFSVHTFAAGSSIGANSPDSTYSGDGSVWIAYQNGADSTGKSGSSTVVR